MATDTGAPTKRLQAKLPAKLHRDFQIACLKQGEDMTTVVTNFIEKYVAYSTKKERKNES